MSRNIPGRRQRRAVWTAAAALSVPLLAGCNGGMPGFLQSSDRSTSSNGTRTTVVERDVEAPGVFNVTEPGLWDGRPSLGGVWVAHPDVGEPERVIIRNTSNDKFVIGALFLRAGSVTGPQLQVSADAAQALAMQAGETVNLNVTALRRESVEDPETEAETEEAAAPEAITAAAPAPAPAPKPVSKLKKPYVQTGIFSVQANADRTAAQMRKAGLIPTVRAQKLNGRDYWRVVVGPAMTASERNAILKQVKEAGFTDAYTVAD